MDAAPLFSRRRSLSPALLGSLSALVFLALSALPLAAAHAAEPSPEVLGKITKLNKKALDAYQKQDYDSARDLLKQALETCNAAHLEHHPITARTEIHIGVLLIGGLKQHDAGIKHFQKAIQIQPDIQITKSLVTPQLQDAFEEAVLGAGGGSGGGDDDKGGGSPRRPPADDEGGATPSDDSASGDEDHPPPRRKPVAKKPAKKKHGDDDGDAEGDDDGDASDAKFFVAVTLGSGYGIASGTGEATGRTAPHKLGGAGFAPAQLAHVSPEVGYFYNPNLILSLQLRYQFITGTNPGPGSTVPTSAVAGFLRGTFIAGKNGFRPFFSVAVGGGAIRHAVVFKTPADCGPSSNMTCVDTFKGGPFLVGPGAGFFLDLGNTVALAVAVNSQLGLPSFTFNIDLNLGLAFRF